jgi:hypothetical protein
MRRDSEYFGEAELDLVYMAHRLRDALKIEDLLTARGFEYLVETGTYVGGLLFKRELTGAFFYVSPADREPVRELLRRNSYKPYEASH